MRFHLGIYKLLLAVGSRGGPWKLLGNIIGGRVQEKDLWIYSTPVGWMNLNLETPHFPHKGMIGCWFLKKKYLS